MADKDGELKIKFTLYSDASDDEIKFYISNGAFTDAVPTQAFDYTCRSSDETEYQTISAGSYLAGTNGTEYEIKLDCKKDTTYYYKLDSSSATSRIYAVIGDITTTGKD